MFCLLLMRVCVFVCELLRLHRQIVRWGLCVASTPKPSLSFAWFFQGFAHVLSVFVSLPLWRLNQRQSPRQSRQFEVRILDYLWNTLAWIMDLL